MGLTDSQLLFQVELPLAVSVILSGVRVAIVISVGLATIAAAIGAGGLGEFIFRGPGDGRRSSDPGRRDSRCYFGSGRRPGVGWLERRLRPR